MNDRQFNKRDILSDKWDYDTYNFAACFSCKHFRFNNHKSMAEWSGRNTCGNCSLMKKHGAYNGVMAMAVCNKYASSKGEKITRIYITSEEPLRNTVTA